MIKEHSDLVFEISNRLRQSALRAEGDGRLDADVVTVDAIDEAQRIVARAVEVRSQDPRTTALECAARREAGELLGRILGSVVFLGCEVMTAPDCVVPRKETELLGRTAVATLLGIQGESRSLRVIDMCCGAGNLACAVACHVPSARVWATDLTAGSCALASRNVRHLGLTDRVGVFQGDLFQALDAQQLQGTVDLICCNPPYISTGRLDTERLELLASEPREAFDGGPYGLSIHQRVLRDAQEFLGVGGWLMFEIGIGQARQLELLVRRTRGTYGSVRWENDELGRPRVAVIQRND